jgi:pimeloyl-ACP methyl ester carboxylesterase
MRLASNARLSPDTIGVGTACIVVALYQYRVLPKIGHNPTQEAPGTFAEAVLELARTA